MENEQSQKIVIIVDAYSSGNDIAPEFIKKGYICAHIQSRNNIPLVFLESFRAADFFINIQYLGAQTVKELAKYHVIAVIAGCETGIELADSLAETLQLSGNNSASSGCRRDKYLMQECLRNSKINHIPTYNLTKPFDAVAYASELFKTYQKLVLKPSNSAGTDSVFICKNIEEVTGHLSSLFNRKNLLNLQNDSIVLQPFIAGEEFVVDTVSYAGRHKICAIWKMKKGNYNESSSICEFTELTSLDKKSHVTLRGYLFECLDSLEIKYGAAHSELFLTKDGWTLIETGARTHGAGFPALSSSSLVRTQIDELVLSVCAKERFLDSLLEDYSPTKSLKVKELISFSSGTVKSINNINQIKSLPSYQQSNLPKENQKIAKTIDVSTSPGWIALSHRCAKQLDVDYQYIVDLENTGMFELYE